MSNDQKKSKVILFNEILNSLLVQLAPRIGSTYHVNFGMLIKANITLPIKSFLQYALPHKDMILNKNDSFFYGDNLPSNLLDVNESFMKEIIQLKNIYGKLDSVSKENMWDIFQSLLILSIEYQNL